MDCDKQRVADALKAEARKWKDQANHAKGQGFRGEANEYYARAAAMLDAIRIVERLL
jgi:hypothetical protein